MAQVQAVQIEQVEIASLKFADYNPRRMMRSEAEALKRSLTEYGAVEPAVVNADRTIIGGHMRVAAAREIGWETFPVVWVDLPEDKAKLLNLALNRISGEWDEDKLAELLYELNDEDGTDAVLELSGFDAPELSKILDSVAGPEPEPAVPWEAPERCKAGDVWQVGSQILGCGDSADDRSVAKLLEVGWHERSLDLIFTSPPYNVGMDYAEHDDRTVPWSEYAEFLRATSAPWLSRLAPGRAVCWQIGDHPSVHHHRQLALLEEMGLSYLRTMIWDKVGIGVPLWYMSQKDPRARYFTPDYQHELVYLLANGTELEPGPSLEHLDDTAQHSLVRIASASSTRDVPDAPAESRTRYKKLDRHAHKVHNAVFPVKLAQAFIANLAAPDELVADPFCGVGSTLIACEKAGRNGVGMEIDATYCDVALERCSRAFEAEPKRLYRKRQRSKAKAEVG